MNKNVNEFNTISMSLTNFRKDINITIQRLIN